MIEAMQFFESYTKDETRNEKFWSITHEKMIDTGKKYKIYDNKHFAIVKNFCLWP